MPDYKEMYFHLMHETTQAINLLVKAQQDCEDMLLNAPETPVVLLNPTGDKGDGRAAPSEPQA